MKSLCILFLALFLTTVYAVPSNWAVLVAGSYTWYNYRHQADVFHAYQMIKAKGFDPQKIIVMAYDDIAMDPKNPFFGKVFNKPSYGEEGVDVYAGVNIDYWGNDVTPDVFLNVLSGNKQFVKGKGTEKVVDSTQEDNIFIFFSDHGAPNLIAFPKQYLYADQLIATFKAMNGRYNKIVFYLQACESGSMFVNLPLDTHIYALSAANPKEPSFGTYCSPDDVIMGKHIGSCLGDLFSVKFIEDTEAMDIQTETLQSQFELIRLGTNLSHVMQWGDLSYTDDTLDNYMSSSSTPSKQIEVINLRKELPKDYFKPSRSIDSRFMKIKILTDVYNREGTEEALRQLRQEMLSMQRIDQIFHKLIDELKLDGDYSPRHMNYQCMRGAMDNHTAKCGLLSDYGLMYAKYYADACERYPIKRIIQNVEC